MAKGEAVALGEKLDKEYEAIEQKHDVTDPPDGLDQAESLAASFAGVDVQAFVADVET